MNGLGDIAPTIGMLAAIACAIGGIALIRRGEERLKGVLMLVMAVVLVGNVLVWTI